MTRASSASPSAADEHHALDLRAAARHLVTNPWVLAEQDPDAFALIRRHEHTLDRWFTQRYGYRLQVTADTARLSKSTVVPRRRALYTASRQPRAFSQREYTVLSLVLAAVAAGPDVISLRDLVHEVRSAAADAEVTVTEEPADRRALIGALRWMIAHGLAQELHDRVDLYIGDEQADAVLRIRPDRVALLPLPALGGAADVAELVDREHARTASRVWMRCLLLEESVLYRSDLTDEEWGELRRRLGEESTILAEMFDLRLEARAEGVAAVDPDGRLTDSRFPRTGTVGHAALLLIERLAQDGERELPIERVEAAMAELASEHRRHWSKMAEDAELLTAEALALLIDHRLAEREEGSGHIRLLPAAHRYQPTIDLGDDDSAEGTDDGALTLL